MLYREQTFAPRAFHSELQQQTNTVNTQKSPPWACDKGCAEACAERFSALKGRSCKLGSRPRCQPPPWISSSKCTRGVEYQEIIRLPLGRKGWRLLQMDLMTSLFLYLSFLLFDQFWKKAIYTHLNPFYQKKTNKQTNKSRCWANTSNLNIWIVLFFKNLSSLLSSSKIKSFDEM